VTLQEAFVFAYPGGTLPEVFTADGFSIANNLYD